MKRVLTFALLLGAATASMAHTAAAQTAITFDVNASGAPLSAPCLFAQTTPLTELYASLGVHFSGPGELVGGAIVNQCGNFGLPARSGTNFLGFNRNATYAQDPETVRFDVPQRTVTIFAGGPIPSTFTMVAYREAAEVARAQATPDVGTYGELSVSSSQGIDRVVLRATGDVFVFDDLSFTPLVPGSKADCRNSGWRTFSVFKNQGDCVSFVATGGKNPPAG